MRTAADLIIENAQVRTLAPAHEGATAVAVKGGRILGVGSDAEIDAARDSQTQRIDASGRPLYPGFIDAHTHFQKGAVARYLNHSWDDAHPKDVASVLEEVGALARASPIGSWIRVDGLNKARLAEFRYPTRRELDSVAPDNPVALIGMGNHSVVANSRALSIAGISADTPDPVGGRVERDEHGEPNGQLIETGKLRLDNNRTDTVLPVYGPEERLVPIERMAREFLAAGVTTIHDMVVDPNELGAWIRLNHLGRLPLRVQFFIRGYETKIPLSTLMEMGVEQGLGDDWLRFAGAKLSVDGVCAFRDAAVYEHYPDQPDNLGLMRIPEDTLDELVDEAHAHDIRLAVHVVGPRAIDAALDSFEKAFAKHGRKDLRHRLEHVHTIPRPGSLERMRSMDLLMSMQPNFVHHVGDAWIPAGLTTGNTPGSGMMPLRLMFDAGLKMLSGTDFNAYYYTPMQQISSAVGRRTRKGLLLDPSQAITVPEAIHMFTVGAAYGGYEEGSKGTIETGKVADLALLSGDPLETPIEEMEAIQVDLTILDGRVVHER